MIYTQLKLTYQKLPPKTVEFRDYRHFRQDEFEQDLMQALSNNPQVNFSYDQFASTFQNILDRHAPLKKKVIRGNRKPFMNRQLRRAIMRRSRLCNVSTKQGCKRTGKNTGNKGITVLNLEMKHENNISAILILFMLEKMASRMH